MEQICLLWTTYELFFHVAWHCATFCHNTMGVLQAGETALQSLARQYTDGDESQMIEAIQKGQLIVAVKSGDIAEVRQLVECQGVDIHSVTRDYVRWATF